MHKNVFGLVRGDKNSSSGAPMCTVSSKNKVKQPRERRKCFYCHKTDHVIADCMVLKRKHNSTVTTQPVGLIKTPSVYEPFLLEGFVSFSNQPEGRVSVQVLRDTGATRSFIRGNVLPF